MQNFLVFSLARCGSTSLMHLLNLYPEVHCINEPFNVNNFEGQYSRAAVDIAALEVALQELWLRGNGIKHVWHPSGWPFNNQIYNDHLLFRCGLRVVFLRRRNILRRIVSSLISQQLNEWSFAVKEDRERLRHFEFSSLDTCAVRWHLANELHLTEDAKHRLIEERSGDYMELWYEDLYDTEMTLDERQNAVRRVAAYLGVASEPDPETLQKISERLDPSINQVNSAQTYARIPRIAEVERQFGSDETGWLFK